MSQGHWLMALAAILLWVASPLIFFSRDLKRWWKARPERRLRAKEQERQKIEAENRVRNELAAKYGVPSSQQSPDSSG